MSDQDGGDTTHEEEIADSVWLFAIGALAVLSTGSASVIAITAGRVANQFSVELIRESGNFSLWLVPILGFSFGLWLMVSAAIWIGFRWHLKGGKKEALSS